MAYSFTLVERTPYRLRYTVVQSAEGPNPDSGLITNRNTDPGANAGDLRFDSRFWRGYPLNVLVSTPAIDIVAARRLMQGDGLRFVDSINRIRGHVYITPQSTDPLRGAQWSVDADEGAAAGDPASAGFAVLIIRGPGGAIFPHIADIDIDFQHTMDR